MRTDGTNEICAEIGDLIEGFAIGALDQAEMLHVARHIGDVPPSKSSCCGSRRPWACLA